MKHIVKFSGGKDSLATLLVVLATVPRDEIVVLFCDTGWEHPDTYAYLTYVEEALGIEIVRVKSKRFPGGFAQLVAMQRRFPALAARFCTRILKVEPGIDYVLGLQEDVTIYQGIRNDESLARRYLKRNDEYFRFYHEPIGYKGPHDKAIKELEARLLSTRSGSADLFLGTQLHDELKRLKQENEAQKKPVYHTYRRKEVLAYTDKFSADLIRPIIPEHARKSEWVKKGKIHRVATIRNVIDYAKGDPEQVALDELRCSKGGCISHYNICETGA